LGAIAIGYATESPETPGAGGASTLRDPVPPGDLLIRK
jgi:hypothetical protein